MVCLFTAGAEADDQCAGPPGEAQHSGSHTRAQQALLQHCHQLPQGQYKFICKSNRDLYVMLLYVPPHTVTED
jgi:hypothetical protein